MRSERDAGDKVSSGLIDVVRTLDFPLSEVESYQRALSRGMSEFDLTFLMYCFGRHMKTMQGQK